MPFHRKKAGKIRNLIWHDIDSSMQTNCSKRLDSSCDSTLTRSSHDSTLTRLEIILEVSDSMRLWLWLDKDDSGTSLVWSAKWLAIVLLLYYSIVPLPWTMRLREKKSFIHLCANKLGLLIRCLEILKINLTRVSSCRLWLESSYSVKWTDSSRINNTVSEQRRNTVIWVPWLKRGRGSFLTTRHYTFFPN